MGRYGNLKGGPDGVVTPEDLRCWRDLVAAAAMAAVGDAARPIPEMARVAKAAKNACAPGVVTRANPCIALAKLANRYVGETTAGRRNLQGELAEAAEAAREQLDGEGRPERKDIHG